MRSSYVLATLVTSMLLFLSGCGSDKKSKNDAPQAEDESADDGGEAPGTTQPPAEKPPVKPNPPTPNPPTPKPPVKPNPPASKFGQIVSADQDSIQTKLLNHYCVACHSGATPKANLNLENLSPYLSGELGAGGYRGVLIFPGRGDVSTLKLVMARHESYPAMPPADNALKIPAVTVQQVEAVSTWIDSLKPADDDGGGIGRN